MAQSTSAGADNRGDRQEWGSSDDSGREWGARRRKVFGYFKAANELRQTYTAQWSQRRQDSYDDDSVDAPGTFSDVEVARSGDEEMVLFPSYARHHVKKKGSDGDSQQPMPGTDEDIERPRSPGTLDYWKQEWDRYEKDNAAADVDVHGWVYTPQRGPMNRKHRLLIALARKLSGIPAPSANSSSSPLSSQSSLQQSSSRREDEDATREAQSIINKAERDADAAWKGGRPRGFDKQETSDTASRISNQSNGSLSRDELSIANAHLMERLRPFMANPLIGTPVTMFFFNDKESQSRTAMTIDTGHFTLRAALDFVPTHVRVMASESLSVTEEIQVIEPQGISLISDVDDTIKHSAISSGAKEIFRNTFVRELGELTVLGVKEWYNKLASMEVQMHYVSNSPWQLFPLLKSYFKMAGLPPGSLHLKQYSGMLQGIFEPTAERKRGALEKILRDFPERKFILVGDSGEADLEVYTELVIANPGRILGVFIRDVTTSEKKEFFDQSFHHYGSPKSNYRTVPDRDHSDAVQNRPALPPRELPEKSDRLTDAKTLDNADLIDLSDSYNEADQKPENTDGKRPPLKPSKPPALRSMTTEPVIQSKNDQGSATSVNSQKIRRKPAPPLPSKPRRLSTPGQDSPVTERPPPLPIRSLQNQSPAQPPPAQSRQDESYTSAVKNMVSNAYNNLPSTARDYWNSRPNASNSGVESQSSKDRVARSKNRPPVPPPVPPPRRTARRRSTSSSSSASSEGKPKLGLGRRPNTTGSYTINNKSDYESGLAYYDTTEGPPAPLPNKREELWRRRWERAQAVLEKNGVILGSWRVGSDVQDITVWLVEQAQKQIDELSDQKS